MTTIQSKTFRNIGPRQAFAFRNGIHAYGSAVETSVAIDGTGMADFAGNPGITIPLVLGNGPATTVPLNVVTVSTTAGAIAADINAAAIALGGADAAYFTTNPPASTTSSGSIRISNPRYVETGTFTTPSSDSVFTHCGVPATTVRDIAAIHFADKGVDPSTGLDRNDVVSDEVVIPDGANVVTVWPTVQILFGPDSIKVKSPRFMVTWSNGTEGAPTDLCILKYPSIHTVIGGPQVDSGPTIDILRARAIDLPDGFTNGVIDGFTPVPLAMPPVEFEIPAGSVGMRILVIAPDYANLDEIPRMSPTIRFAATFAAR